MKVVDLTKEIYEKYPEVWYRIIILIKKVFKMKDWETIRISIEMYESFFKGNGIVIIIFYDIDENKYWIEIAEDSIVTYLDRKNLFEEKNDAKCQAILKACEMLENKL